MRSTAHFLAAILLLSMFVLPATGTASDTSAAPEPDAHAVAQDVDAPQLTLTRPVSGEAYAGATRLSGDAVPPVQQGVALVVKETLVLAEATDAGSGIARGELWIDGRLVATDAHAPFRWWGLGTEALGFHDVTVKAYDHAGNVASVTQRVLLVSSLSESASAFEADPNASASCIAAGAAYGYFHDTFTDVSENAMLARSLANLSISATKNTAGVVAGPGGRFTGGLVTSTCETTPIPAHTACASASASDPEISLAPLPATLRARSLRADGCSDPAHTSGTAITDDLRLVANGQVVARFDASAPNTLFVLRASNLTRVPLGADPVIGYLILNEQHDDIIDTNGDGSPDCRRHTGSALHLIVLDPLTDFQSVAADVVVGLLSVSACKMTPQLTLVANPSGGGVLPGAAARTSATARGPIAGQRAPTGDVAFQFCAPGCVTPAPFGVQALNSTGVATSAETRDTVPIGAYCWGASYAGDVYYQAALDATAACFATSPQRISLALTVSPAHAKVVPYSSASAKAWLNQTGALPAPTGTVTFTLCPAITGGGSDGPGPVEVLAAGCPAGTGPAVIVSVNAVSGNVSLSGAFSATGTIGKYCWGAAYSGDTFYLPEVLAPSNATCFSTVRQPATLSVAASAAGPFDPNTAVGASATVSGPRVATGDVLFFTCSPRDVEPGAGCLRGGTQVGGLAGITSGVATSTTTFSQTNFFGLSCYRAVYGGDAYYLPGETTNAGAACYRVKNPCATSGAAFGAASVVAGGKLAVGMPGFGTNGAVCLFDAATGAYEGRVDGTISGGRFGAVLGESGGILLVGAPDAGKVHRVDPVARTILTTISGSAADKFGAAVAGASSGRILVGAPGADTNGTDAGIAYLYTSSGTLERTLWTPSPHAGDGFGSAVASVGNFAIIGAPYDDAAATNAGAVHVMTLSGDLSGTVVSPTQGAGDLYGSALARLDSTTFLVGAPGANRAHAHTAATGSLARSFVDPAPATGNRFGASVGALDGHALVGAPGADLGAIDAGAAYLMHSTTGALIDTFRNPTPAVNDQMGASVAGGASNAFVGAPGGDATSNNGGAGFFFDSAGAPVLSTVTGPSAGALAGAGLAVDGDRVVVGMPGADRVEVRTASGVLVRTISDPNPAPGDRFGAAVATWGDLVLIGAPGDDTLARDAGAAYLYSASTGALLATLARPTARFDDFFGAALAIDGERLVVGAPGDDAGAPGAGAVFVYDHTGARLATVTNPTPAFNDAFGQAVALRGTLLAVGAPGDDLVKADAGAVHLFDLASGTLVRTHPMPNAALGDGLGASVAFVGGLLASGAPGDDAGATNSGSVQTWRISDGAYQGEILRPRPQLSATFGASLAASGAQLLVGAPGDDAGAPGAGAAYMMETGGGHIRTLLAASPTSDARFGAALAASGSNAHVGAPGAGAGAAYGFDAPRNIPDLLL